MKKIKFQKSDILKILYDNQDVSSLKLVDVCIMIVIMII